MKKLILALWSLALFASCGNATEETTETTDTMVSTDTVVPERTAKDQIWEKNLSGFPPECGEPGKCNDGPCQEAIVVLHKLEPHEYNQAIEDYYGAGSEVPEPYVRTKAQIEALMGTYPCDAHRIEFNPDTDPSHQNTHEYITLRRQAGYSAPAGGSEYYYSFAFFKGLINRGATTFEFRRAKSPETGNNTLAVRALNGGTEVFIGDLSDTHPGLPNNPGRPDSTKK